ncbi:hypothetical protein ACOBV9_22535 (plasmid) [Pseudoalteromonas espejiana]
MSNTLEQQAAKMTIGSDKFKLIMPPKFNTLEEQRSYEKQRLAAGFRVFAMYGFDEGLAGTYRYAIA